MSSEKIAQEIVEAELRLQEAIRNYETVILEMHTLNRQILELRIKTKDLSIVVEKAKNIKQLVQSDLRILKDRYWQEKNENL